MLSPRTRLVAVTAASNLIGTRPPVRAITDLAHEAGALTYVDGVHFTAHAPVHVDALGADFFACSPYKFLGPHCGVLAADPALLETLRPDKLLPSTDARAGAVRAGHAALRAAGRHHRGRRLPGRARAGRRTPPGRGWCRRWARSRPTRTGCGRGSRPGWPSCPAVVCYSRAAHRTPTLLLGFAGRDPAAAYAFLAERGVNAPAGSFYALEASRRLGLGDTGGLRIGLAPYIDDVGRRPAAGRAGRVRQSPAAERRPGRQHSRNSGGR